MTPVHELAICEAVLRQVLDVAASHDMRPVMRITLRIGPLAGVEPDLLRFAFPLVAAGTPCDGALIDIECSHVEVRCHACGQTSEARSNRLLCACCGGWRVSIVSGEEMLLARVEFSAPPPRLVEREPRHV